MSSASPVALPAIDTLLRALASVAERPGARAASDVTAHAAMTSAASPAVASTDAGTAVRITDLARLAASLDDTPVALRLTGHVPLASVADDAAALAAGLRAAFAENDGHAGGADRQHRQERSDSAQARPTASPVDAPADLADDSVRASPASHERALAITTDDNSAATPRVATDSASPSLAARGADPIAPPVSLRLAWDGETWPGQRSTLTVERDTTQREGAEAPFSWRTTLVANLPALGPIRAELVVCGTRVNVALAAPDGDARTQLGAERGRLLAALARAGFAAGRIEVRG
jgi:hypothetical protein